MTRLVAGFAVLAALGGCTTVGEVPTSRIATVALKSSNGLPAGTAVLLAAGDKVSVNIAAVGLGEGQHGVHLHMVGTCEGPGFTTAGAHLNPDGHEHGSANPKGSHLGDLPNLTIGSSGAGTLVADLRGSRAEVEAALFDSDGTALVVHTAPDDLRTDPTGNSGARIACGVLKRP